MAERRTLDHDWYPRPLPGNVRFGSGSWLYSSFAFLHYRSTHPVGLSIGHSTGVYLGTLFDLGPRGRCEIGDYGTIAGPVITSNHGVFVGDHALISFGVVLADSPFALPLRSSAEGHGQEGRDIVIGDNCWIGARSVLLGGARLGEGVIVGAGAVVDFEVPPFAIVAGNPGRVVGSSPPVCKG